MRSITAALLTLAAAACAAPAAPSPAANYLAGTRWVMIFPDDYAPDEAPPTISFEHDRATGFAGCNRWFASVTHDGEALRFGDVGTTRMACPAGAMSVERAFIADLGATRYSHYDQHVLVLLDERQVVIARYERN